MNNDQIPPLPPTSPSARAAPVSAAAPANVITAVVRDAPQNTPRQTEGRVVSSNPKTREMKITTPRGEITVESDTQFPPETEVTIDLYMQKNAEMAKIAILRREAEIAKETAEVIKPPPEAPPAPPLKAGDVVTAIILPETPPPATAEETATPPPALPYREIAAIVAEVASAIAAGKTEYRELPPLPPELAPLVAAIRTAPDGAKTITAETIKILPPAQLAALTNWLAQPATQQVLQTALPDDLQTALPLLQKPIIAAQNITKPAMPSAPPPLQDTLLDNNLFGIIKAQIAAKSAIDSLRPTAAPMADAPPPATPPALFNILRSMMPLLENSDSMTEPMPAYIRQMMPQAHQQLHASPAAPLNMAEIKIIRVIPPHTPPEQMPLIAKGTMQMTGTVEAVTPKGFPIIKTDTGSHFVLRTPHSIEPQSTILFDIRPLMPDDIIAQSYLAATAASTAEKTAFAPLLFQNWPALDDALQLINHAMPTAATQAFKNTLPTPTQKMVPTALFFLAALRMGAIENWLGAQTLQTLRDMGRRDLADNITQDFGKISSQAKETLTGDWRGISMPLLHDEHLHQLKFFVRQQHDHDEKNDGETRPVTRFLLNLNLSRMGDMQLDGLLRQKQFDLILRTQDKLPEGMRRDLMQAFARALEQTEMQGGLSFQVKNWVNVQLPAHDATLA